MKLQNALKLEGSEQYQLLNYFVFDAGKFPSSVDGIREQFAKENCKITQLYENQWPVKIVLVEFLFSSFDQLVQAILFSTLKGASVNGLICSVCMFDGVFMDYSDLFSPDNSTHVYSFFSEGLEVNIAMNDQLRNSEEWKNTLIEAARSTRCHRKGNGVQ